MFLPEEIFLRADDLAKWVGARDNRPYFAAFDIPDEVLEHFVLLKRAPEKRQVFEV
jgi:hypothetical protein